MYVEKNMQIEEQKKEQEMIRLRKKNDLGKLLKQPEFRRFIWGLLNNECGLYAEFNILEENPLHFFNGKRFVALAIRKQILDLEPCFLAQMAAEEASEKNSKKIIKKIKEKK